MKTKDYYFEKPGNSKKVIKYIEIYNKDGKNKYKIEDFPWIEADNLKEAGEKLQVYIKNINLQNIEK